VRDPSIGMAAPAADGIRVKNIETDNSAPGINFFIAPSTAATAA